MEENTRIIQQVGRKTYDAQVKEFLDEEYKKLIGDIFNYVPPVDAYLPGNGDGFGFCKVSYFPFPFTLQLAFDGQS